ncbi:type II toxin-antitoxin system VapC family toxin [Sphingomonas sp. SUN019]|uniref:type II toxin-antitoxin system VapC family toxin n=1 Tax=Sphingomonas sp. SUN019 TaxID=2937788 RepID=UPI002164A82B|nr:type II toxin-antitoxin system VapC family toxin [Sphingomonas sp. SUN019]UVO51781.1 type II toxin-antitoxin system VapC family toxin [Sphingomonas sp. SUN019]
MIVDTSALMAIILGEPERDLFIAILASADTLSISAGSWVELGAVIVRRQQHMLEHELLALRDDFEFGVEPVTVIQADLARVAYREYGRGTGHPAKLNFGDCFAYALARETGEPLLFKGNDFSQTDINPAVK